MNNIIDKTKELERENGTVEAVSAVDVSDTREAAAEATDAAEYVGSLAEPLPVLEYTEVQEEYRPTPNHQVTVKKRRGGITVFVILAIIAVFVLAASALVFLGIPQTLHIENVTELPEGVAVPAFTPIDPAEFMAAASDELITVPDETGLELPPDSEAAAAVPLTPQNYYTQTPNVSEFFVRAAQDESYVYFLKAVSPVNKRMLYDLMRMRISNGKTEPVGNANEISGSIYSFTLWEQNMITCEYKRSTETFAFYRVPKTFEDAQMLFEQDSPALMNVYDNKIFMLFPDTQQLGVFDPETDKQPSFIDMGLSGENVHYFPEFSVVNGYLYYGVWYEDSTKSVEYFRRSLYTGETVSLLSCEEGDFIRNPCWDENGGVYYSGYDDESSTFSLIAQKDGGTPQALDFPDFGGVWPLIALKDEALVAASTDTIYRYNKDDFSLELETQTQESPFTATKDYLVAPNGIYRIFDLGFTVYGE